MKLSKSALSLVSAVLLVSGCVSSNVGTIDAINGAKASGSSFTQHLTAEYRAMVNNLQNIKLYQTSSNALRFSRKGIAASQGTIVLPETLADWDLTQQDMEELAPVRADLIDALESGGREALPEIAAIAQTRFDCWVMEDEIDRGVKETTLERTGACKKDFMNAMARLRAAVPHHVVEYPAPVADAPAPDVTPVQQVNFLVFFDWDKSVLSQSATEIMSSVQKEILSRKNVKSVVVTGFTDTSGSEKYNDDLSLKRARTVNDYLVNAGVSPEKIRMSARGEHELLVQTRDNVRQPENRRVSITLE